MPPGTYELLNDGLISPAAITPSLNIFYCDFLPESLGYDVSECPDVSDKTQLAYDLSAI